MMPNSVGVNNIVVIYPVNVLGFTFPELLVMPLSEDDISFLHRVFYILYENWAPERAKQTRLQVDLLAVFKQYKKAVLKLSSNILYIFMLSTGILQT